MTSSPVSTETPIMRPLGPLDEEQVFSFLERNIANNLFILSWLDNYGFRSADNPNLYRFFGAFEESRLTGVALVITGRLSLLDTETAECAAALGRFFAASETDLAHIVSSRAVVTPFWREYQAYSSRNPKARLDRQQQLYVISRDTWMKKREPRPEDTALRLARRVDLDAVFLASAMMHKEETLEDPLEREPENFRRHVCHRIDSERTYVWFSDRRRLIFKADVSAQSRFGAQISGVFTPPDLRGQGIATRGMRDLVDALFARGFPRVSLYVNEDNIPAIRVYEKIGFRPIGDYQTVFVMEDD